MEIPCEPFNFSHVKSYPPFPPPQTIPPTSDPTPPANIPTYIITPRSRRRRTFCSVEFYSCHSRPLPPMHPTLATSSSLVKLPKRCVWQWPELSPNPPRL